MQIKRFILHCMVCSKLLPESYIVCVFPSLVNALNHPSFTLWCGRMPQTPFAGLSKSDMPVGLCLAVRFLFLLSKRWLCKNNWKRVTVLNLFVRKLSYLLLCQTWQCHIVQTHSTVYYPKLSLICMHGLSYLYVFHHHRASF